MKINSENLVDSSIDFKKWMKTCFPLEELKIIAKNPSDYRSFFNINLKDYSYINTMRKEGIKDVYYKFLLGGWGYVKIGAFLEGKSILKALDNTFPAIDDMDSLIYAVVLFSAKVCANMILEELNLEKRNKKE